LPRSLPDRQTDILTYSFNMKTSTPDAAPAATVAPSASAHVDALTKRLETVVRKHCKDCDIPFTDAILAKMKRLAIERAVAGITLKDVAESVWSEKLTAFQAMEAKFQKILKPA